MELRDWTGISPPGYRRCARELSTIRAAVLHQCGFEWKFGNSMWRKVRAHYVVHRTGDVTQLHPIDAQMRFGSGPANPWCVTIEHEGNLPMAYRKGEPRYWKPDIYGRSTLAPAQILASRKLLVMLAEQLPGLQVGAHRQIDELKSGCCGPDIWREVGQYAVDLGFPEMPVSGGLAIPDTWRTAA